MFVFVCYDEKLVKTSRNILITFSGIEIIDKNY